MRKSLPFLSVVVLFFFVSMTLPRLVFADDKKMTTSAKSYRSDVGTCRKARTTREENKAPHIFFPVSDGRDLWKEIALGRLSQRELDAMKAKMVLKEQKAELWKGQFDAAYKTLDAQGKVITDLRTRVTEQEKRNDDLQAKNNQLVLDVAKHKGEKYTFLFWGVVGGAATVLFVVGGVAIYMAVANK